MKKAALIFLALVFSLPAIAQTNVPQIVLDPWQFTPTVEITTDWSDWYEVAGGLLNVDPSVLQNSPDSLAQIALAAGVDPRDLATGMVIDNLPDLIDLYQGGLPFQRMLGLLRFSMFRAQQFVNAPPGGAVDYPLNLNRFIWNYASPQDYDFSTRHLCYCYPSQPMYDIEIRGGLVSAGTQYVYDFQAVPPVFVPQPVDVTQGWWPDYTFNGMFDRVQDAIDDEAYRTTARTHPVLGFITNYWVDDTPYIADEEFGIDISDYDFNP